MSLNSSIGRHNLFTVLYTFGHMKELETENNLDFYRLFDYLRKKSHIVFFSVFGISFMRLQNLV